MDLGIFFSSRRKAAFWILAPIFFLITFYSISSVYFKTINAALKDRRAMVKLAPVLNKKILTAKTILKPYEIGSSKTDIIELLNTELNKIAQETNFTMDSLIVERTPKASEKISVFKVAVNGEGSSNAIMNFLNNIYMLDKLFAVKNARLRAIESEDKDFYNAEVVFLYYNLQ